MNKINDMNGGQSPIQKDEKTFIEHDKKSLNEKENRTQDLFFSVTLGLTSGLIFGEFFNAPRSLIGCVTATMFPMGWAIYPFKPYSGTYKTFLEEKEGIDKIACLCLSFFVGVCVNIEFKHMLMRLIGRPHSNSLTALVLVVQSIWIGTNIFAAYRLRKLDPPHERLHTCYSLGCSILYQLQKKNHFTQSDSSAQFNPSKKEETAQLNKDHEQLLHSQKKAQGIGMNVSSFFENVKGNHHSQKAEQQREKIRQSVINDITRLKQSNLQCQQLFQWMESFIKSNSSLHTSFKSCLKDLQKNPLLPIQIVDERSVGNELIDKWGREQTTEHYLYAIKTRVRLFFERNSEFYAMLDNELKETPLSELQQSFWKELTPAFLEQTDVAGYEKSDEDQFRIMEIEEDEI